MISFADTLKSLYKFLEVQEAIAIGVHQPEGSLDLEIVFVVLSKHFEHNFKKFATTDDGKTHFRASELPEECLTE